MADDFPVVLVYCVLVYDYLGKSTVEILINYVEDIALCVIEGIADFRGCQSFEMVIFALFVPIAVQFYFLIPVNGECDRELIALCESAKLDETAVSVSVVKFGADAAVAYIVLESGRLLRPRADNV